MPKQKAEDPRAIRSKRMFKEAVVQLLVENPDISKLTVQKIAQTAELNRATFYLHFVDIRDLLKQIVYDICNHLSLEIAPKLIVDDWDKKDQLVQFLDYFYKHRKIISVFFSQEGFKKKIHIMLKDMLVVVKQKNAQISLDVLAASIIGTIMWWLKDGVHFSSEYIAQQIIALHQ